MIKKFPIIDKNIVRKQIGQFVYGSKLRHLKATTGGSTGQPFVFYMDRFRTRQMEKAFIFALWSRVGYRLGDPIFNLRGRTPKNNKFTHHDRFFNIYFASSFNLKFATVAQYVDEINRTFAQINWYPPPPFFHIIFSNFIFHHTILFIKLSINTIEIHSKLDKVPPINGGSYEKNYAPVSELRLPFWSQQQSKKAWIL